MKRLALLVALASLAGCSASTTERLKLPPLDTVAKVDLGRYVGSWYEVASFPQRFQRGCVASTATYTARDDGEIDVLNRCREGALDAPERRALGRARVVDAATSAKLEVSFFRPFWGDYWVIDLDPGYAWAVVGHPGRDYLWILSRTPTMPDATYEAIVDRLRKSGHETARLVRTQQPPGARPFEVPGAAPPG
jgi:apolipoprotein D and lipocalin family protein